MGTAHHRRFGLIRPWLLLSLCFAPLLVSHDVGCASSKPTTQPMTAAQEQDAILRDPMNYKPQVGHDITSGDITHFDNDGFKRDLNDVFNP